MKRNAQRNTPNVKTKCETTSGNSTTSTKPGTNLDCGHESPCTNANTDERVDSSDITRTEARGQLGKKQTFGRRVGNSRDALAATNRGKEQGLETAKKVHAHSHAHSHAHNSPRPSPSAFSDDSLEHLNQKTYHSLGNRSLHGCEIFASLGQANKTNDKVGSEENIPTRTQHNMKLT